MTLNKNFMDQLFLIKFEYFLSRSLVNWHDLPSVQIPKKYRQQGGVRSLNLTQLQLHYRITNCYCCEKFVSSSGLKSNCCNLHDFLEVCLVGTPYMYEHHTCMNLRWTHIHDNQTTEQGLNMKNNNPV